MLKKSVLIVVLLLGHLQAMASEVLVDQPSGAPKGLVIIAPAKKYLMRERLFSTLAEKLASEGYVTVRFNWSPETLQVPELEIQRASEDIKRIVESAQRKFGFSADETTLISKSFSTKALGPSLWLAKAHILLTPNCSVEAPFQKTYGEILNQSSLSLSMIISNEDPYCDVNEIRQTLGALDKLALLSTTHGDHNFVLSEASGELNFKHQDEVIERVVDTTAGR